MTGSASAEIAYAVEQSYLGGVGGSPTYRRPGRDTTITDLTVDNALDPLRAPDEPFPIEELAQEFETGVGLEFVLSGNQFHEIVYNNDSDGSGLNDSYASGLFPSFELYVGLDYADSGSVATTERQLKGCVVTGWEIQYQQGSPVTVSLTTAAGSEEPNQSVTPGTTTPETDTVPFHGAELSIDGVTQEKLSSATLSLQNVARLERGPQREPVAATLGAPEVSLDTTAIFSGPEQYKLALGGSSATSPQDLVGGSPVSLTFDRDGTVVADYTLSGATPATYAWEDIPATGDTNTTEPVTFEGTGLTASS
jgi:hypothetical protein